MTEELNERGVVIDYGAPEGEKGYSLGQSIMHLNMFQANITLSGTVHCKYRQEDCAGVVVKAQ